jgi:type I restriction enzyme S subunit
MSRKSKTTAAKEEATPALVPKLRFPEFRKAKGWKLVTLGNASVPVAERVGKKKLTPVSISAGIGFVRQSEKFGRDISGNQYQLYTLVRDGDFVFNKGNSLKFPEGCVYLLQGWEQVAAPNVFICFRLKDDYSNGFFQNCFEQNQHGRQLKRHITSGARSNGLLNISKETFFGVEIPTPTLPEQQKIAECLSSVDELMGAQARKVDALKTHKKGLMQQLFPREGETQPRLRFPEFQNTGEWEPKLLGDLVKSFKTGKLDANAMVENGQYRFYTCAKNHYQIDRYAFEGEALLVAGNGAYLGYIHHYIGKFNAYQRTYVLQKFQANVVFLRCLLDRYLPSRIQFEKKDGNTPYIVLSTLTEMPLVIPQDPDEQQRIAACLTSLDDLIAAQTQKHEALKTHKKGLMQQLFPSPTIFTS